MDTEVRFLSMLPDTVREFILYEAAINWCAKTVWQGYQLHLEQDAQETIAWLKRCERKDLYELLSKQDEAMTIH